jgi:hypothetical protein
VLFEYVVLVSFWAWDSLIPPSDRELDVNPVCPTDSPEDTTGIYETVLFPKVYNRFCHMLNEMRHYLLKGKVEQDFTAVTLTVHWIEFLDKSMQRRVSQRSITGTNIA